MELVSGRREAGAKDAGSVSGSRDLGTIGG